MRAAVEVHAGGMKEEVEGEGEANPDDGGADKLADSKVLAARR